MYSKFGGLTVGVITPLTAEKTSASKGVPNLAPQTVAQKKTPRRLPRRCFVVLYANELRNWKWRPMQTLS